MHGVEDDRDGEYAMTRVPGRMYISRRFPYTSLLEDDPLTGKAARFGYTVLDETGHTEFFDGNGWDLIIRETPTRQQLKAMFFEDARGIMALAFQRFASDGRRLKRECFTLRGEEIGQLDAFLALIRSEGLTFAGQDGMRFSPGLIRQLVGESEALAELARKNPELLATIIRSDVSAPDVVALARRREVLREFGELLNNPAAFAVARAEHGGPEKAWQKFIETNPWIVGGSLAPQFLHSFDASRLEQTVRGNSVAGAGKRVDAMLRTAGALSAVVLVEIKHHNSDLLGAKYRPDCWRISDEVAGGVAQCQATAAKAERDLGPFLDVRDDAGYTTDRVAVCRPRSILVAGTLAQFLQDGALHAPMYESFERFRRSLRDPEIVTFDELYQRACMILELATMDQPPQDALISDESDDMPF
jgi:hypothetical protein